MALMQPAVLRPIRALPRSLRFPLRLYFAWKMGCEALLYWFMAWKVSLMARIFTSLSFALWKLNSFAEILKAQGVPTKP